MKIHPLFKHFGSKWSGAKHYPAPNGTIYEPFAGSAGYALNHVDSPVTLWEDDNLLQLLWSWLIYAATSDDIRRIPIDYPVGYDIQSSGLNIGQSVLLKHWQRTNNCGNCWTISPWGNKPGQWTANTRARVAEEVHAIKHWKFEPVLYTEPGTYFVDPPYWYNYRYRFTNKFDFDALTLNLSAIPKGSRLIVCEATCPKTGAVPTWMPFVDSHRQVTSRRKTTQNHHSRELVYMEER